MKLNGIKGIVMGLLVAVVFFVSVGSTTASAQGRRYRGHQRVIFYRHYNPFWDTYPIYRVIDPIAALREQGYSDGRSRGKDDAKDGRASTPYDQKQYYKSNSLAYREAFLKGYAEGYHKQIDRAD
ncbi:MAG: hypothetical protein ABI977_23180 [Acidobacteriota bacterium]